MGRPDHRKGWAWLIAFCAWNLNPCLLQAADRQAGVIVLATTAQPPSLAGDLAEVLIAALSNASGVQVLPKERFRRLLEKESRGKASDCTNEPDCIQRVGQSQNLNFVVIGELSQPDGHYQLLLVRVSIGGPISRRIRLTEEGGLASLIKQIQSQAVFLTQPEGAWLSIICNQPEARVALDGQPIGKTPLDGIEIPPGEHTLSIRKAGFKRFKQNASCSAGQACVVNVVMEPSSAVVSAPAANGTKANGPSPVSDPVIVTTTIPTPISAQRIAAWTMGATAIAVAAAATGLGIKAYLDHENYNDLLKKECNAGQWCSDSSQANIRGLASDIKKEALSANILFGLAGGAALTSVLLFIFEPRPSILVPLEKTSGMRFVPMVGPLGSLGGSAEVSF